MVYVTSMAVSRRTGKYIGYPRRVPARKAVDTSQRREASERTFCVPASACGSLLGVGRQVTLKRRRYDMENNAREKSRFHPACLRTLGSPAMPGRHDAMLTASRLLLLLLLLSNRFVSVVWLRCRYPRADSAKSSGRSRWRAAPSASVLDLCVGLDRPLTTGLSPPRHQHPQRGELRVLVPHARGYGREPVPGAL